MNSQIMLPSFTLYRRNCHSSQSNYFCYLSSTTQFKILQFSNDNKIKNSTSVTIPLEPVKGICLQVHESKVYTAVALLTRFIIFEGKQVYYQSTLELDTNIAYFKNGHVAVNRYEGDGGRGFAFVTRNGGVVFFNLINKNRVLKLPQIANRRIQSLAVDYPNIYLGTQQGKITHCKINNNQQNYTQLNTYDTTSKLPILIIAINKVKNQDQKEVICTTCEGQVFLLSSDVKYGSIVSAHRCLISRLLINEGILFTVGEDMVMNKFQILGNRKIKLISSENYQKIISMLSTINSKPFISFYQTPIIRLI